jgi:hypothetical protein
MDLRANGNKLPPTFSILYHFCILNEISVWIRDLCCIDILNHCSFFYPLNMLAIECCPLSEDRSQESEIGGKYVLGTENCRVECLFDDLEHGDLIDNRISLWSTFDPFLERQTYAEVLDFGNQDPNRYDYLSESKSDEEVLDGGNCKKYAVCDGSGGIGLDNGILGGLEKTVPQSLGSEGNSTKWLKCPDQRIEVGTCLSISSEGMPPLPSSP